MGLSGGGGRCLQVFERRSDIWEFEPLSFVIEAFVIEGKAGLIGWRRGSVVCFYYIDRLAHRLTFPRVQRPARAPSFAGYIIKNYLRHGGMYLMRKWIEFSVVFRTDSAEVPYDDALEPS